MSNNDQSAKASGMVPMSVDLFDRASHLLPESRSIWVGFLATVRSGESGDWYWYDELGKAIERTQLPQQG